MTAPPRIDDLLRDLDPAPADRRARLDDADWARAMRETIPSGPAGRARRRVRRGLALAATAATAIAIAGLMAALLLTTGHDDPPVAARPVTLVATPAPGGPPVGAEALQSSSAILVERARLLGTPGLTAVPRGGAIDVTVPDGAPPDLLTGIRAPGRLLIVPDEPIGEPVRSLDSAVRAAQAAAGVAVTGGGEDALPDGFVVAREEKVLVSGAGVPLDYLVYRRTLPVTEAGIASARLETSGPEAVISVVFTADGADGFAALTRRAAQNGRLEGRLQGLAIILDGRLITNPVIDYETNPDGLQGNGAQIPVPADLDPGAVAAQLSSGPLPLRLRPEGTP